MTRFTTPGAARRCRTEKPPLGTNRISIVQTIHDGRHYQLSRVVDARNSVSLFLGLCQGGQEQARENGDNGNHNQQLDQRKAGATGQPAARARGCLGDPSELNVIGPTRIVASHRRGGCGKLGQGTRTFATIELKRRIQSPHKRRGTTSSSRSSLRCQSGWAGLAARTGAWTRCKAPCHRTPARCRRR